MGRFDYIERKRANAAKISAYATRDGGGNAGLAAVAACHTERCGRRGELTTFGLDLTES
jgi:hypothetical protein